MSDKSKIEWTDATWNPVRGCTKVSPGCKHCYAETFAERFRGVPGHPYEQGFDLRLVPEKLDEPLRWRKPRRIFVNSMSDLFHDAVPFSFIDIVLAVMAFCPQHTFQVLTKRPGRMAEYFAEHSPADAYTELLRSAEDEPAYSESRLDGPRGILRVLDNWEVRDGYLSRFGPPKVWPLPNVWLGVSVEDQRRADDRIPHLLRVPAAVRFLSCEPLLGPIDLVDAFYPDVDSCSMAAECRSDCWPGRGACRDDVSSACGGRPYRECHCVGSRIAWAIVGGESGPGARPMHPAWARSIRDDCAAAGVAYHFKQWGGWAPIGDDTPRGAPLAYVHARGGFTPAISGYEPGCPCDSMKSDEPMVRVGKKAAGRRLDGVEHDGFPEVP